MAYTAKPLPFNAAKDVSALADHVAAENRSIELAQYDKPDSIQLNVLHKSPAKLRDGIIVCADGVDWQPLGAGGGFFGRFGGAWVKLNN